MIVDRPVIWILPEAFFGHCFAFILLHLRDDLWSLIGLSYSKQPSQGTYHQLKLGGAFEPPIRSI
ncbi:hypothetical protein [Streptococcus equi]|uniref:hypothetical protein n=1 Tax=Streptococcus equi TaxID=1336 RepID=UPI001E5DDB62|nr:hypothetical protein [Streptococcus equi]